MRFVRRIAYRRVGRFLAAVPRRRKRTTESTLDEDPVAVDSDSHRQRDDLFRCGNVYYRPYMQGSTVVYAKVSGAVRAARS